MKVKVRLLIERTSLIVNKLVQKARHEKFIQENCEFKKHIPTLLAWKKVVYEFFLKLLCSIKFFRKRESLCKMVLEQAETAALDYPKRVLKKSVLLITAFFVFTSLNNNSVGYYTAYDTDYQGDFTEYLGNEFVMDDEGYLVKMVPSKTNLSQYLNRDKIVIHEVQPSEYTELIADKYGLSVNTILWANGLRSNQIIYPGQKLKIPVADGVLVTVKEGDHLDKYADKYKVEKKLIIEANNLEEEVIYPEDELLIPGAKPIQTAPPRLVASSRSSSSDRSSGEAIIENDPTVSDGGYATGSFVKPTSGILTQGFHSYHYAWDIANRARPPIVAMDGGTVTKSQCGWNNGYGCTVSIDHGNGYASLYAHMSELWVSAGQSVLRGQGIGRMGNTGRVYGVTGIHLHVELSKDGVKIPLSRVGIYY